MNPGLVQGFVRFGTLAHKVLVLMLEAGTLRHTEICNEFEVTPAHVAATLQRLSKYGFIFAVDRASQLETGTRTETIYALQPEHKKKRRWRPATPRERTANYRANKKAKQIAKSLKVPSIFHYRGTP